MELSKVEKEMLKGVNVRCFPGLNITGLSQKLCNILVFASLQYIYDVTKAVQVAVGSTAVVSVLTHCAMLHSI